MYVKSLNVRSLIMIDRTGDIRWRIEYPSLSIHVSVVLDTHPFGVTTPKVALLEEQSLFHMSDSNNAYNRCWQPISDSQGRMHLILV